MGHAFVPCADGSRSFLRLWPSSRHRALLLCTVVDPRAGLASLLMQRWTRAVGVHDGINRATRQSHQLGAGEPTLFWSLSQPHLDTCPWPHCCLQPPVSLPPYSFPRLKGGLWLSSDRSCTLLVPWPLSLCPLSHVSLSHGPKQSLVVYSLGCLCLQFPGNLTPLCALKFTSFCFPLLKRQRRNRHHIRISWVNNNNE